MEGSTRDRQIRAKVIAGRRDSILLKPCNLNGLQLLGQVVARRVKRANKATERNTLLNHPPIHPLIHSKYLLCALGQALGLEE